MNKFGLGYVNTDEARHKEKKINPNEMHWAIIINIIVDGDILYKSYWIWPRIPCLPIQFQWTVLYFELLAKIKG